MSGGDTRIEAVRGDITEQRVDVIVNAANTSLLGGGGVDGAIHRAAGPGLLEECRTLRGCPVGEARITNGYDLPARHVIHTVGPRWKGGGRGEEALLRSCYRSSLDLGAKHGLRSIAFPSISTGAYRYPIGKAAPVALGVVADWLAGHPDELDLVRFVLFGEGDLAVYREALGAP